MGEEHNSENEQSNNEEPPAATEEPEDKPLTWKDLVNIDNTWVV